MISYKIWSAGKSDLATLPCCLLQKQIALKRLSQYSQPSRIVSPPRSFPQNVCFRSVTAWTSTMLVYLNCRVLTEPNKTKKREKKLGSVQKKKQINHWFYSIYTWLSVGVLVWTLIQFLFIIDWKFPKELWDISYSFAEIGKLIVGFFFQLIVSDFFRKRHLIRIPDKKSLKMTLEKCVIINNFWHITKKFKHL